MPQKRNYLLDALRFFSCVLIVFIHCPFPGAIGQHIMNLGRFCVPFFLLMSGWYACHPDKQTALSRAKKKLKDTLKLLLVFVAAYVIMNSLQTLISHRNPVEWVYRYCNLSTLFNLLLFNRAVFFGSTAYYPFMLVYVYAIFLLLVKTGTVQKACRLIPALLACNIICGEFTSIPWYWYGNFLFTGLPFFLLGYWLHTKKDALSKRRSLWPWLLAAGVVSTYAEAYFIKSAYCFVGSILISVSLFALCLSSTYVAKRPALIQRLQRYSLYIFIIHCGVRDVLKAALQALHLSCPDTLFPLLVLFLTILISMAWDHLATRKKAA